MDQLFYFELLFKVDCILHVHAISYYKIYLSYISTYMYAADTRCQIIITKVVVSN